jgi:putative transposase
MTYRRVVLANNEVYHVINRGVEKRKIFLDKRDYSRFFRTFVYYQKANPPVRFSFKKRALKKRFSNLDNLVEIVSYCLMPNHFHFLLKQVKNNGISLFIGRLTNSYTRYFNTRHKRTGHLFQGPFKAVRIETDEQLIHVSRYIHLNPVVDFLVEDLKKYPYSSYLEYLDGKQEEGVCQKKLVLDQFSSPQEYEKFVLDQKDYAQKLKQYRRFFL